MVDFFIAKGFSNDESSFKDNGVGNAMIVSQQQPNTTTTLFGGNNNDEMHLHDDNPQQYSPSNEVLVENVDSERRNNIEWETNVAHVVDIRAFGPQHSYLYHDANNTTVIDEPPNLTQTGNSRHTNLLMVTPEDARDEEEDDTLCSNRLHGDDPYVYSDDSASLSDAYFFPQSDDDLASPARYRNEVIHSEVGITETAANQHVLYPFANYYGSMGSTASAKFNNTKSSTTASSASKQRSKAPLWITTSSIQEDTEEIVVPMTVTEAGTQLSKNGSQLYTVPRKEKRKLRKNSKRVWFQEMQQRKREKVANRETLVNRIRGRPQSGRAKDVIWAYLFLAQLVVVCISAIVFGRHVVKESSMAWELFVPNPMAGRHFHYWRGENRSRNQTRPKSKRVGSTDNDEVIPVPLVLQYNSTTNELQYNENLLKKRTTQTGNPANNPPTKVTTIEVLSDLNAEASGTDVSTTSTTATTVADTNTTSSFVVDLQNVLTLLNVSGFYACAISYMTFILMIILSRCVIHIMLIFSIVLALGWGMTGLSLDPYGIISVMGFTALLLALWYAMYHWRRVQFAAANLNTALIAVRCTADVALLGFGGVLAAFAWLMIWSVAVIGFINMSQRTACDDNGLCHLHIVIAHIPIYLFLLLSYHWTNTVLKNILRVTVATVIGTWWFYPTDIGYICTAAVAKPLFRSLTKNLGSISLGSFVVQPAQFLCTISGWLCSNRFHRRVGVYKSERNDANGGSQIPDVDDFGSQDSMNHHQRESVSLVTPSEPDENGTNHLCCCLGSILDGSQIALESYNCWSFTYIGMYGYGCNEGGFLALKLFKTREWLEVVKDGLIQNLLLLACVTIGGTTGTFAVAIEETGGYFFSAFQKPLITAFVIGSVVGYVLSNILLFGVVGSAANTILVCFAAGPFEFHKNHHRLSLEMRQVWSHQVWEPPIYQGNIQVV